MNSGQPSPSWPSLYNPAVEIIHINGRDPIQPKGVYLHEPDDIFRFTLYWTLVFNCPIFVVCGVYAFLNLSFPAKSGKKSGHRLSHDQLDSDDENESPILDSIGLPETPGSAAFPLSPFSGRTPLLPRTTPENIFSSTNSTAGFTHRKSDPHSPRTREQRSRKSNARRSRLTFALLVLLSFLALSLIGSVLSSAVVGFILLGLFKAGGFFMSTWIPFLWALIHTLVGLLSIWPSVIDII